MPSEDEINDVSNLVQKSLAKICKKGLLCAVLDLDARGEKKLELAKKLQQEKSCKDEYFPYFALCAVVV